MRKTSVYLSDEETRRLEALARRSGRSQAALIREAISAYELNDRTREPLSLIGSGRGRGTAIADIPEEELLEGFGK